MELFQLSGMITEVSILWTEIKMKNLFLVLNHLVNQLPPMFNLAITIVTRYSMELKNKLTNPPTVLLKYNGMEMFIIPGMNSIAFVKIIQSIAQMLKNVNVVVLQQVVQQILDALVENV